ncbi:MAG: DUF4956 domain-containing protein [Flavobacteriaceae bacterium]|nr:DUF4956 domain-containing protein [Flavobacteriaceae bacterium]
MEFLDIPLFDDDFYKMLFRFVINTIFLVVIIRYIYYVKARNKNYLFTYFMISTIVFFLCFTLKKYELDLGMALGLFAIFGIIRYRTDPIPIKEMTYLFVVIGVSVVNSLANSKMSYAEIIGSNVVIVISLLLLEKLWFQEKLLSTKKIVYEKIENIKPENYHLLNIDLEKRTGLKIEKTIVKDVDFLKDTANIVIYYDEYNQ